MRRALRLAPALLAASLLTLACGGEPRPARGRTGGQPAEQWKPSEGCPPVPVPPGDFDWRAIRAPARADASCWRRTPTRRT